MSSHPSDSSNPVFQTPQPDQLQSEADRKAMLQELTEQQGTESDPLNTAVDNSEESKSDDPSTLLENMDNLADRHLPSLDSPPG